MMNRFNPVPPISNRNNRKQQTTTNNIKNNKNKMADNEKFDQLEDDFSLNGEKSTDIASELQRRLARLHNLTDYSTDVGCLPAL